MSDELLSKTYVAERRRVERKKVYTGGNPNKPYPQELYFVTERQGATWLTISKGYPHSTSAYAYLGRVTSKQAQKATQVVDRGEERMNELLEEHQAEADRKGAEFYNFGWAQGEDFVHSKTSKGKLYSEFAKDGSITHEWQV